MTERVLGPTGGRRRKRLAFFVPILALAALTLAIGASAGPVSDAAGFQGDDGNLIDNGAGIDWNNFGAQSWQGTAPFRQAHDTEGAWSFTGLEDAQATTSDSAFAGGAKQDDNCASLNPGKAPNKDDMKRAYFADTTVQVGADAHSASAHDHVFLSLAWVRIAQNTTSPSAHIGFEFNKGETSCGSGSPLVQRTAGDMLIVYDFEGGSGDVPVLTLRRWVTSGSCEVGSSSPPCWGTATNLTAGGIAEGRVNTSTVGPVQDGLAPSPPETLGLNEFGEAVIDLTKAGVFTPGSCESFGKGYAVSRSSGNSGTAAMKDLVGPGDVDIENCGSIVIRKVTSPSPDPLDPDTPFEFDATGGLDPASFTLKNGESNDYGSEVLAGSYTVSETPDSRYTLSNISCSASSTTNGSDIDIGVDGDGDFTAGDTTISITLEPQDSIDCTFTNTLNKANPTATTAPSLIPHDSATLSGVMAGGSPDGAADGSVTFELYKDDGDATGCEASELVYSFKDTAAPFVTVNDGEASAGTKDGYTITTDDLYKWLVIYAGDTFNNGYTVPCGDESINIDVEPDPS